MLPQGDFDPARLVPGTGVVQLTACEYRETDVGPYNDFSVVIPLYSPRFPGIPLHNARKSVASRELFNLLLHRAATSEHGVVVCLERFRWPMLGASVEISESADRLTCEVKEDGEPICRMHGPGIPVSSGARVKSYIHTPLHLQRQRADINFKGYASVRRPSGAGLELGSNHPTAHELSGIIKSTRHYIYSYSPSCQLIAYGPE